MVYKFLVNHKVKVPCTKQLLSALYPNTTKYQKHIVKFTSTSSSKPTRNKSLTIVLVTHPSYQVVPMPLGSPLCQAQKQIDISCLSQNPIINIYIYLHIIHILTLLEKTPCWWPNPKKNTFFDGGPVVKTPGKHTTTEHDILLVYPMAFPRPIRYPWYPPLPRGNLGYPCIEPIPRITLYPQ